MTDNAKSPILSKNVSSSIGLEPLLRFPGFEGDWQEILLGEFCKITMGQSPDSASYNNDCIGLPLVQGNADMKNRITVPQRYSSEPTKIVDKDTIILSVRAPVGTVGRSDQKVCLGRGVCGIVSEEHEFMYQYLLKHEKSWKSIEQGGTFTAINSDDIKSFKIYIPTKTESTKIADFLSLVDQRIEKQRQLVEVLKRYKRGALLKIFEGCETWTKYLAKDVGKISTGSSNTQDSVPDGTYPFFIRSVNVSKSNKFIYDGEAVLTIGDGQIGKVFHYINGKFDCHQRVYMITKFTNISGRYFYHFFSTFFYNRAMKMSARNTVDSVRMEMIADMPIYVPDRQAEVRIVNLLDGIDSQIQQQEHVLEYLNIYKNGLLQQMFV